MINLSSGDRKLGPDFLQAVDQIILDDERLASQFSTMYRISGPTSRKLIGTMTRPALHVAA